MEVFHLTLIIFLLSNLPRPGFQIEKVKSDKLKIKYKKSIGFLLVYYLPTPVHVQLAIFMLMLKFLSMLYSSERSIYIKGYF